MKNVYITILICILAIGNLHAEEKTLGQALGYPSDAKLLIINADDFGMCHSSNVGTQKTLEYGLVTSATIMMPCSWVTEAIRYIKEKNISNIGVHMTLTSEWGRYRWNSLTRPLGKSKNTLLDENGYMWAETSYVEQYTNIEDVKREVHAQIKMALDRGVNASHFDSHMGSLYGITTGRTELLAVAFSNSYEFGLPFRMPYLPGMEPFRKKGFAVLDNLIMGTFEPKDPKDRKKYFIDVFTNYVSPGVNEIYVHPAIYNDELRNITAKAKKLQADTDVFTDPEVKDVIKKNNIILIDYRPLRKWQREKMNWNNNFKAEHVFDEYRELLQMRSGELMSQWREKLNSAKKASYPHNSHK